MFGRQYAAALLLANAGKSAMKALIGSRPELADWITFTPDFGFIQVSGDELQLAALCCGEKGVRYGGRPELADWIASTPDFGFIQVSSQLAFSAPLGCGAGALMLWLDWVAWV
jgi:hypothetical protein